MATLTPTQRLINGLQKQRAFAWAKFYEECNLHHDTDYETYQVLNNITTAIDVSIPTHIKEQLMTMATELKKTWECPICIDMIEPKDLAITNCGHYFCKECLDKHKVANRGNCVCPQCRRKITTD